MGRKRTLCEGGKMELDKDEISHIMHIMTDRGISHCRLCISLYAKLKKEYSK